MQVSLGGGGTVRLHNPGSSPAAASVGAPAGNATSGPEDGSTGEAAAAGSDVNGIDELVEQYECSALPCLVLHNPLPAPGDAEGCRVEWKGAQDTLPPLAWFLKTCLR